MNKIAQILDAPPSLRRVELSTVLKAASIVAMMLMSTVAAAQHEPPFEPIPGFVSVFLQEQFDMVPAPDISARMPRTTCRNDTFEEPVPSVSGEHFVGAYYCMIDYGCGEVSGAPVRYEADGDLWFGPDSAGRLVAMHCADSITNDERRKHFSSQVHQGG